jgi:transposase-like protein
MKKQTRRKFTPDFKAKAAIEAVKNQQTLAELAKKFEVNPIMISSPPARVFNRVSGMYS